MASLIGGCEAEKEKETSFSPEVLPDIELFPKPEQIFDSTPVTSFIEVLSSEVEVDFPKALTFSLAVESSHRVTVIELLYKSRKVLCPSVMVTVQLDFKPGTQVETDWIWDTRKSFEPRD